MVCSEIIIERNLREASVDFTSTESINATKQHTNKPTAQGNWTPTNRTYNQQEKNIGKSIAH